MGVRVKHIYYPHAEFEFFVVSECTVPNRYPWTIRLGNARALGWSPKTSRSLIRAYILSRLIADNLQLTTHDDTLNTRWRVEHYMLHCPRPRSFWAP